MADEVKNEARQSFADLDEEDSKNTLPHFTIEMDDRNDLVDISSTPKDKAQSLKNLPLKKPSKPFFNKTRSLSRQLKPNQLKRLLTLTSMLEPNYDVGPKAIRSVSVCTYEDVQKPLYSMVGADSARDSDVEGISEMQCSAGLLPILNNDDRCQAQQEIFELVNDHDLLAIENSYAQLRILELESSLEDLQQSLQGRKLVKEQERLDRMVELEAHNRILALECSHLREALHETEQIYNTTVNSSIQLSTSYNKSRMLSTQLLPDLVKQTYLEDNNRLELEAKELENQDLRRLIQTKDKEIKKLVLEINSRSQGFARIESELYDNERKLTNYENKVESKLQDVSLENDSLMKKFSALESRVEDQSTLLQVMEKKLAAEQETVRIADMEKKRLAKKLEELGAKKRKQNTSFMTLFDEI